MENNLIVISVKDLPYKKMNGMLTLLKINPDLVAKSISVDSQKYCRIRWQDYLVFSHKIKKIVLLKKDGLFFFVGYSKNNETIIYNDEFSKFILNNGNQTDKGTVKESTSFLKTKLRRIDILLDKVGFFGINSLTADEKNELHQLSKKI